MSIMILELIGLLCMFKIIVLFISISFGVEHIPKEIKKFINNKNITNIFRIQAYESIMCRYFCIGFIDFMLVGKILTEYINLFSPNNFKKNIV